MHETRQSRGSNRFSSLLILGTLLCVSWMACSRTHRQRRIENPVALPERLQTWEGEGGQNQMDAASDSQA